MKGKSQIGTNMEKGEGNHISNLKKMVNVSLGFLETNGREKSGCFRVPRYQRGKNQERNTFFSSWIKF